MQHAKQPECQVPRTNHQVRQEKENENDRENRKV